MIRRDRAEQPIDPTWLAKAVASLQIAHPAITVTKSVVDSLHDFLTWQWRQGRSSREAVAMTCAAGGKIKPSAAAYLVTPSVRAPDGARPGESFGASEIRQPATVARLDAKIAELKKKLSDAQERAETYEERARLTRDDLRRSSLYAKAEAARDRTHGLQAQLAETAAKLRQAKKPADPWKATAPQRARNAPRTRQAETCPPSRAACSLGLSGGVCGLPATLVLAASRGAPVPQVARYCLTSADRLIPSHDARRGFIPRSDYPEDVQEREYHRDKAEQYKVLSTAQNLIPELIFNGSPGAIDGLPVVTQHGIVLGGNGRAQALQLHYSQGGHTARDYLLDHSGQFGFTRAQVAELADPVVVRVVQSPDPGSPGYLRAAQEFVRVLNVPLTQVLGVRAEAVAESKRLTDEVLEILSVALTNSDGTLADYLSTRQSRTLADALRRAAIITDRNAARLLTSDGQQFSDDGKRFVERILTAAVLPDATLLDRLGPGMVGTMAAGAPWLLSAAANGEGWDLRKPLMAAARDFADMRSRDIDNVDNFLRQGAMFGRPAVSGDPTAERLLRLLFDLGTRPNRFRSFTKRFASIASQHPINQASMFAADTISPSSALERALELSQ